MFAVLPLKSYENTPPMCMYMYMYMYLNVYRHMYMYDFISI